MFITAVRSTESALRHISAEQLRYLGTPRVVYLKATICDGEQAFVLYAADGMPLAVIDEVEAALEKIAEHGLGLVTVH
jgi:hypothetical protein